MSNEGLHHADNHKCSVDLEKYPHPSDSRRLRQSLEPIDIETLPNQQLVNEIALQIKYQDVKSENMPPRKLTGRQAVSSKIQSFENGKCKASPKSARAKFKECSQQGNLNGFLQRKTDACKDVKSPETNTCTLDHITIDETADACDGFKVSSNLFMSPRSRSSKGVKIPKKKNKRSSKHHFTDENVVNVENIVEVENVVTAENVVEVASLQEPETEAVSQEVPIITDPPVTEPPTTPKQDVFQLLMDRRNKVIGANSPGRKLQFSPTSNGESPTKSVKEVLKQRKSHLEEWAQIKGAAKRKLDELRGQQINNVLESRAKRIKEMLAVQADNSQDVGNGTKPPKPKRGRPRKHPIVLKDSDVDSNSKLIGNGKLDDEQRTDKEEVKEVKHEDNKQKGFLSSLGVVKSTDETTTTRLSLKTSPKTDLDVTIDDFHLKTTNTDNASVNKMADSPKGQETNDSTTTLSKTKTTRQSKKNKLKADSTLGTKPIDAKVVSFAANDEVLVIDDENTQNKRRSTRVRKSVLGYNVVDCTTTEEEKPKKIAPIFVKAKSKQPLDPDAVEARNNFLYSGVPDNLKLTSKQSLDENYELDQFPTVSHVQQKCASPFWKLERLDNNVDNTIPLEFEQNVSIADILSSNKWHFDIPDQPFKNVTLNVPMKRENLDDELECIKNDMPDYPVYRCFKTMRERNGFTYNNKVNVSKKSKRRSKDKLKATTPSNLPIDEFAMWPVKYKAKSSGDIIGNQRTIEKLKRWLDTWLKFSEEFALKNKRKRRDSTDFESDSSSRDSICLPGNTMILRGPPGSGKTSAVYAICEELDINVLELNGSSRRTGKRLMQEMQEATRSHQVRKKQESGGNMLTQFLDQKQKKAKHAIEDETSEKEKAHKMCVVLIEDVDVVFEQDDGFITALTSLVVTSKRPIILVCTDVGVPHLQKFIMQYPILHFSALSASTLAAYMEILCLVEGVNVDRQSLGELIEWNKGDARRTLLQLQFWVSTGGDAESATASKNSSQVDLKLGLEGRYDDYSDCSFLLSGVVAKTSQSQNTSNKVHTNCIQSFHTHDQEHLIPTFLDLSVLWWNIPNLLGLNEISHDKTARAARDDSPKEGNVNILKGLSDCFDALSFCDVLTRTERKPFGMEPCPRQWDTVLSDSLLLREPLEEFKSDRALTEELEYTLLDGRCRQFVDEHGSGMNKSWNFAVPSAQERKWRHKQHSCELMFQDAMALNVLCERASFSLDYFPTLRHICRVEARRLSCNGKRGNRFYHYLRTLSMDTSPTTLSTACNALSTTDF